MTAHASFEPKNAKKLSTRAWTCPAASEHYLQEVYIPTLTSECQHVAACLAASLVVKALPGTAILHQGLHGPLRGITSLYARQQQGIQAEQTFSI